jgi:NADH dehydrogenase
MNRFVAFCRYLPLIPIIGDGRTPVYPIAVRDVARAVVQCALREDARELVLDLPGPERLTLDEVVRTIQTVLRRRRPLVHHPVALMKILSLPLRLLPAPPLSPDAVDFVTQSIELDGKPAFEYLGMTFRPLAEGLREYLS